MLARLIRLAVANRLVVLVVAVALAGLGVWSFNQQTIDAYPDISAQVVRSSPRIRAGRPRKSSGR